LKRQKIKKNNIIYVPLKRYLQQFDR